MELQAAVWRAQGLATQHTEHDPAACHALCRIIGHSIAWLKIPLGEAEVQPPAAFQSGRSSCTTQAWSCLQWDAKMS